MLGRMGEHTNTDDVRVDDAATEDRLDETKEPIAAEPEDRVVTTEREPRRKSGAGKWLGLAALLLALIALAISVINVVRPDWTQRFDKAPAPAAASGPSQQDVDAAKKKACDAYNAVGAAVTTRTNSPVGPDPVQTELVNINARQAFVFGHDYLLSHLDDETPGELADSVRKFADDMQDVALNSLAGVSNDDPAQAGRLQNMVDLNGRINELCK
jgi:hypothetical protein